jgi:hypothetical protein
MEYPDCDERNDTGLAELLARESQTAKHDGSIGTRLVNPVQLRATRPDGLPRSKSAASFLFQLGIGIRIQRGSQAHVRKTVIRQTGINEVIHLCLKSWDIEALRMGSYNRWGEFGLNRLE